MSGHNSPQTASCDFNFLKTALLSEPKKFLHFLFGGRRHIPEDTANPKASEANQLKSLHNISAGHLVLIYPDIYTEAFLPTEFL